jgi:hypothetical protein
LKDSQDVHSEKTEGVSNLFNEGDTAETVSGKVAMAFKDASVFAVMI